MVKLPTSMLNIEIESLSRKFSNFLQTSQRYASLDSDARQLIFIQDIPNTIGSSALVSQARRLFQSSIKEFLLSPRVRHPIVLVVTETEAGSGDEFGYSSTYNEGLTVRSLLGDDILNHRATSHITYIILLRTDVRFNPIAKTIMTKAMQGMQSLKRLPKELLQSLVDMSAGDIRSAINCATLVAMQIKQNPRRKPNSSLCVVV